MNAAYVVHLYKKNGELDHKEEAETLARAEHIRARWMKKNGIVDFSGAPTIWKFNYAEAVYERMEGY